MDFYKVGLSHPQVAWSGSGQLPTGGGFPTTGDNFRYENSSTNFQLKNVTTGLFHTVDVYGNPGEEALEILAGTV